MDRRLLRVASNERVAERVYRMRLEGELLQQKIEPGQFLHLKCGPGIDPLLRRPISVCDVDDKNKTLDIIYRVEGAGTKLLSEKKAGAEIDALGPLGSGFPIEHRKRGERALLIGGGVGVPPLLYLARRLADRGARVTSVIGFGEANQVFLEEELGVYGEVFVTTIDGSRGHRGVVTDLLNERYGMDENAWDVLYACGPLPMLKALQSLYEKTDKEAYLSLEQRMGCGVGACLACVYAATPGADVSYVKTCVDGPVFELRKVVLA